MNEITHIHLGRQPFTIAVDAHHVLRAYLAEIKKQAGNDVTEEVELRMAELLGERGVDAEKVILMKDVEYLKEQLGEPADFSDEAGAEHREPAGEQTAAKRLFRDTDNAMLAGVCAGLAKYLGVDTVIVRLIFVALLFFGGGGFLLYVVLWLVVPEAKTQSDRLQMQGKPVTVDSIKEVVDRADVRGAAKRGRRVVGPVIETVAKIIVMAFGIMFITVGVSILLALATAGIYTFTTQGSSIAGQAFFPIGTRESLLLVSGLVTAAIIAFIFVLMGLAMANRKWKTPGWVVVTIAGVLIVAIAATASLGAAVEPAVQKRFDALSHTQTVAVSPFKNVVLHGDKTHFLYQPDSTYKLEYHYLGSPAGTIAKSVSGDTLTVDTANFVRPGCHFMCIYSGRDLEVTVHAPSLANITVLGDKTDFSNNAAFTQDNVHFTIDKLSAVDLRYVNPAYVLFAANPDQDRSNLTITGLRTSAFVSDELSVADGSLALGRAGTVELQTDAQCRSDEPMVNLLSFPEKLIINGHTFPTSGDLRSMQRDDGVVPFNCAQGF